MQPTDFRLTLLAAEAKVRPSHIFHLLHALYADPLLDLAAFATFAKLEACHVERMAVALRSSGLYPEGRASKRRVRTAIPLPSAQKATRLADPLQEPADWIAWAQQERQWDTPTAQTVFAEFCDYWHGVPGQRGVKLDWFATFRNWCRRSHTPNGTWQPEGSTGWTPEQQRAKIAENEAWLERVGRG